MAVGPIIGSEMGLVIRSVTTVIISNHISNKSFMYPSWGIVIKCTLWEISVKGTILRGFHGKTALRGISWWNALIESRLSYPNTPQKGLSWQNALSKGYLVNTFSEGSCQQSVAADQVLWQKYPLFNIYRWQMNKHVKNILYGYLSKMNLLQWGKKG